MALAAGLAALFFPPLRETMGIDPSDAGSFAKSRRLFDDALAGHEGIAIGTRAGELGFTVKEQRQGWQGVMISEPKGRCEGRGTYLIRQEAGSIPLAITAPHRGADRQTGTLAASLFLEGNAKSAAWNSAPRNPLRACPHAIDVTRERDHAFTAFARAFAAAHPEGVIIQLHGFESTKRQPGVAREAAMILSNGSREPGVAVLNLADCLSVALSPHRAAVFPNETDELGALSNVQSQALGKDGFDGFVHLEISAELRAQLVEDKVLRTRLRACLEGVAR